MVFGKLSKRKRRMAKPTHWLFAKAAKKSLLVCEEIFFLALLFPPIGLTERMREHAMKCEKVKELKLWSPDADPKAKRQKTQTVLSFGATNVQVRVMEGNFCVGVFYFL